MEQMHHLRSLAISRLIGLHVGADVLIQAGVDALVAGVDTPSLRELAGLTKREEPEAGELFDKTMAELDLVPDFPMDKTAARWELVRWWCQLMVERELDPAVAGRLIWFQGWHELGYPDALQPIVGWTSEYEDWHEGWDVPREVYGDRIVEEARNLLLGAWPPVQSALPADSPTHSFDAADP